VELGVNHIDTADAYGPATVEQLIHEALHPYPDDFVIATKGGFARPRPDRWKALGRKERYGFRTPRRRRNASWTSRLNCVASPSQPPATELTTTSYPHEGTEAIGQAGTVKVIAPLRRRAN